MAAAHEVEACVTEWQLLHVGEDERLPVRHERYAPPHVHFHEPIGEDRCKGKWVAAVANVENPFSGSDVEAQVLLLVVEPAPVVGPCWTWRMDLDLNSEVIEQGTFAAASAVIA